MSWVWRQDNEFELLENGEEYFPAVFKAIDGARDEVIIETFILFDDKVGRALRETLSRAGRRGVQVDVTVDGYGTDTLPPEFIQGLLDAGVRFHVYDPRPRILGFRVNLFRRMHRKIVTVDGQVAFVGGINFSADHLGDFGPTAKQDYAVRIRGPLVTDITEFARKALKEVRPARWWRRSATRSAQPSGDASGMLILRDNDEHPTGIERAYRSAIRRAQRDILIANAYFFPGYRLLHDLVAAARRGVRVRLILQGEPDMRVAQLAASMLYDYLTDNGVQVYEYCDRPLHGKVACIDSVWSTVGSSNLDPFSLALNLEANVIIHDRTFAKQLCENLETLIANHCRKVSLKHRSGSKLRRFWTGVVVFHVLRRVPRWAGSLPAHKGRLQSIQPTDLATHVPEPGQEETV